MKKVFATQPLENEAVQMMKAFADVHDSGVDRPLTREEFLRGIDGADAVILVWHTEVMDKEAYDAAPNLKIVARRGVGYDNIDVEEATRRGIYVTVCPIHTPTIADLNFGLILNAARRLHRADAFVRTGQWTEGGTWVARKFMGYDVHHKTLGILGLGRIGYEVGKRGRGFDMRVIYHDLVRKEDAEKELGFEFVDFDTLLASSDFLSINCSLNESTRGLIDADAISKMKDGAIIVVTARGGIVDQRALYEALKSGKLGGAGLDVFDPEPIEPDDPLLSLDNVVFTPHLGTSVHETRVKMATTVAEDVIRALTGKRPRYLLNAKGLEERSKTRLGRW